MVSSTRPALGEERPVASYRDVSFEVDFFCKSCKGHYAAEYRPALGEPLHCRCGATTVMIYSAVKN